MPKGWNMSMPLNAQLHDDLRGAGSTNLQHAPLPEEMGYIGLGLGDVHLLGY